MQGAIDNGMHHEAWLKDVLVFLVAAGLDRAAVPPRPHRRGAGLPADRRCGRALWLRTARRRLSVGPLSHHRGSRAGRAVRRAWRHVPAVPDRHRDVDGAAVVAAPLRRRHRQHAVPALGGRLRHRAVDAGRARHRRDHPRPRACDVLDRGGDAASGRAGTHRDAGRAGRDCGAAVPGPDGRAGAVRRRDPRPRRRQHRASGSPARSRRRRSRWP